MAIFHGGVDLKLSGSVLGFLGKMSQRAGHSGNLPALARYQPPFSLRQHQTEPLRTTGPLTPEPTAETSESASDLRSVTRAADTAPDVLLIFVGHSADAKLAAARITQLESKIQRQLEGIDTVMNGALRFRRVKLYEWSTDTPPFVDGQKQIDRKIDQAHVGVFVFQDRLGLTTADELERCRKRRIPLVAVFAKNPSFKIETGEDMDRYATAIGDWQQLKAFKQHLPQDWAKEEEYPVRPQDDFGTLEELDQIVLDQLEQLLWHLCRSERQKGDVGDSSELRSVRTKEQLQILYESLAPLRRPCPNASPNLLNWDLVDRFAKEAQPGSQIDHSDDFLRRLGLFAEVSMADKPELHMGAVLCFCDDPLRFIPEARAVFLWGEPGKQSSKRIRGPLVSQFQELFALTKQHLSTIDTTGADGLRAKESDIPEDIVREVISNAIAHRDYGRGHVKVEVTSSELIVSNPGEFPPNTSWNFFISTEDTDSIPRDETVATYMMFLLAFEGVGQGFRLFRRYRRAYGDESIRGDESTPGMVKVRIKRRPIPVESKLLRQPRQAEVDNSARLRLDYDVHSGSVASSPGNVRGSIGTRSTAFLLDELVLELTDLKFHDQDGMRRASAHARLVYEPATQGQLDVHSAKSWRFVAPIGPIEAEELRWYLEKYAVWPSDYFRDRARQVEESLVKWGQLLHEAALPPAHTANVLHAWGQIDPDAGRRFSVLVDATLEAGAPATDVETARESATVLLGLPWELLHDGRAFLFQGAKPTRVRRRLPNTRILDVPVFTTPIRILLVAARPEDEACAYIDHRASALPLVEAMEALGGLVHIRVLDPPTLTELRTELDRARRAREPYHVVHFDGHGVYDRRVGLGGLCFEDPQDVGKLEKRRHLTVYTNDLGPLLSDHRIPLVFLEACQTATAEKASESVASELLKVGVASVVAMSHGVLVETARRFVEAFYDALARGARVGDAMLHSQRTLKDDTFRGRIFGVGELRLQDWFVPMLFQEKDDPQLFGTTPDWEAKEDLKTALAARLGELPAEPEIGFIGRSRELLALERLLREDGNARYAVVRGQGGEGKTALAAELARWMVRSQQIRRAAFVSVETHSNLAAVLDAIGRQLMPGYSVATYSELEQAILPVERALTEQSTLLLMDNMESVLLPPYLETPEALSEEAHLELDAILKLCARLNAKGETRMVFTSREALPAPFDAERNRRELHQLDREDAVKLVERVLNQEAADAGAAGDAARETIEQLVDAVHGHARTLALLAPTLRSRGVEATRSSLVELMAEMERKFPGSREKSLFASVEISLRRMSPVNRDKARVLGVFYGAVDLDVLRLMMEWEKADVASLAVELIETGLATPNPYDHLTVNPALCPYLRGQMDTAERESLTTRWVEAMLQYAEFLNQQQNRQIEIGANLTVLELPNLFALLDHLQRTGDAEATIGLATSLYSLLQELGKPRLLERVARARDAAAASLGQTWNHARFEAHRTRIEQQLSGGRLREAFDGAQELLQRGRAAGETGYPSADYDLAIACFLLARVLKIAGASEQALPLVDEAQKRFGAVERDRPGRGAERMESACFTERGDCFLELGRLDEAATAYEESIRRAAELSNDRDVAVGKGQLGSVRLQQHRYREALEAYEEARERFTRLDEPGSVAVSWHQTGSVFQESGQPEAAEDAYLKSLTIKVGLGDVAGQAATLVQLGNLYTDILGRPEQAVAFYRQAADKYVELHDDAGEGRTRNNLGDTLRKLRRFDEARQEVRRAIECKEPFGHAGSVWNAWSILDLIETADGSPAAATKAKRKAKEHYLAYRRDGGENHNIDGRISLAVTQTLLTGDLAAAAALLDRLADDSDFPNYLQAFLQALQAIVAGSRDRALADAPDLDYSMAAEILFLIETLEKNPS